MHTINVRKPNGRYRIADGAPVLEAPLTDAQQSALAESQALAGMATFARRTAVTAPAIPARIDATAGGRFQGWRCP